MKLLGNSFSLRARFNLWFASVCLLPLLLVTTVIYRDRVKVTREMIFDKLSAAKSLRLEKITEELDEIAADARGMALGAGLVRLVKASIDGEGAVSAGGPDMSRVSSGTPPEDVSTRLSRISQSREALHELAQFQAFTSSHRKVPVLSIIMRNGTVLLSTDVETTGKKTDLLDAVKSAARDQHVTFSEVFLRKEVAPSICVMAPIFVSGRVEGVISACLDLRNSIYPILENRTGMGRTGESLIVNRDMLCLNPLRSRTDAALNFKIDAKPAAMAAMGHSGIIEEDDYSGTPVLASYSYIPRTGWGLICKQDQSEIYEPFRSLLFVTFGLATMVGALSFFLAFLAARYLTKPIQALSDAARMIEAGNYDVQSSVEGPPEIEKLSSAFNSMSHTVRNRIELQNFLAELNSELLKVASMDKFFDLVLPWIIRATGARMAAIFTRENGSETFLPRRAIGAGIELMRPFDAERLEGELGILLTMGGLSRTSVRPGSGLKFTTSFGEIEPVEMIAFALSQDHRVSGFVSIGGLQLFEESAVETVRLAIPSINSGFARIAADEKISRQAERLANQNNELIRQTEELNHQSTELSRQSDELYRRNRQLSQQKRQLEEATRLKSEFLSNMSHELRTPLNSVLALSRILSAQGKGRLIDEEMEYLEIIERNGRHLLALINDILDLSRIESGKVELLPEQISPFALISEVVESLRPIAEQKGISIVMEAPPDVPMIFADPRRLHQILQNLAGNAVKFTSKGEVKLSLCSDADSVLIKVADTGIGIAPSDMDAIFEEFRQADGSSSRSYEGTGLGLAIARKTAVSMGGTITADSDLGKGSVFTLRIPLVQPSASGNSRQNTESGVRLAANAYELPKAPVNFKNLVLVVDDDHEIVDFISTSLESMGFDVARAYNGHDALALAKKLKPFAITLDILLPDMDGWEVMNQLRSDQETQAIPVIVVSMDSNRDTACALGAVGIISKPIDMKRLSDEIMRLTRGEGRTVLVVDDQEHDRIVIAAGLKEMGMDVLLGIDGPNAIEMARRHLPDLITLDLIMPGMDGTEVLGHLKSDRKTSEIPVLVVTSKDLDKQEYVKLTRGVSAILSKGLLDKESLMDELASSLKKLGWKIPMPTRHGDARILIVEDSEAATIQVRYALESVGFTADSVSGGAEAVEYLDHHVPDGVVLDLMMPGVDGFDVLERVRRSPLTMNVPVMVITAKTLNQSDHEKLRKLEVLQIVQKGDVTQDELISKVRLMLRGQSGHGNVQAPSADASYSMRPGHVTHGRLQSEGGVNSAMPVADGPERAEILPGNGPVLIIEDNPDNMLAIKAIVRPLCRTTIEACDAEAGLELVKMRQPALVLCDMHLPGRDGFEFIKALRECPEIKSTPVVAVTAQAMNGDRERILSAGFDGYVSKPIEKEEIASVLRRYCTENPCTEGPDEVI